MGTYDTKEEAKERLRQVEYFKHKDESLNETYSPELDDDLNFYIEGEGGIKDEWYQYGEVDVDKWVDEATSNSESPELIDAIRKVCEQMNNGTYYDPDHAEEWSERYPYGYYNNESDYGVDESLNEDEEIDSKTGLTNTQKKIVNQLISANEKKDLVHDLYNKHEGDPDWEYAYEYYVRMRPRERVKPGSTLTQEQAKYVNLFITAAQRAEEDHARELYDQHIGDNDWEKAHEYYVWVRPNEPFEFEDEYNDELDSYLTDESLNEAKFSNATANDDVRLVRASYDHFINDLGEIPSPDDILYDIIDNYDQDIFKAGDPFLEGRELEAIKFILRSQGLEYRGDFFDESLNEGFVGVKGPVQTKYDDKFNLSNAQERTAADIIGACWAVDPYADMYEFTEYTPDMEEFFGEEPSLEELVKYYVMHGKEKEFLRNLFDIDGQIEEVQSWEDPDEESTIEFLKSVRDKYLGGEEDTVRTESLTEAKNDTLNPAIWDENNELKPEVKETLQNVTDTFIHQLEEDDIPLDVKDLIIVGSNANYNYGPQSDVDLHIVADLSPYKGREKELLEKIYQAKKSIFNDKYDPTIRGFEVEIYVEPAEDKDMNEIPDEVEAPTEEANESLAEAKYTKDELVDKFGTDDLDLINAGNEENVELMGDSTALELDESVDPEVDYIEKILRDDGKYYDVYPHDGKIYIDVDWGDWKHDHLRLDNLMFMHGYECVDEQTTEEDGSDTYSSTHIFVKSDLPEDDPSTVKFPLYDDESLDEEVWFPDGDEEPTATCPTCGEEMTFVGYQGYEEEFKCPVCGEYHYFKDGKPVDESLDESETNEGYDENDPVKNGTLADCLMNISDDFGINIYDLVDFDVYELAERCSDMLGVNISVKDIKRELRYWKNIKKKMGMGESINEAYEYLLDPKFEEFVIAKGLDVDDVIDNYSDEELDSLGAEFYASKNSSPKPSFHDYMKSQFGDDTRWEENPDVEDYYRNEYNHLYGESLNESAFGGIRQQEKILKELKKLVGNPDYKNTPEWEEYGKDPAGKYYDSLEGAISDAEDWLDQFYIDSRYDY